MFSKSLIKGSLLQRVAGSIFVYLIAAPAFADTNSIEINAADVQAGGITSGDTPGFPVTISKSGSYRLTGNLNPTDANVDAIEVVADSVTIDLGGFSIEATCAGVPCVGTGRGIRGTGSGLEVRNGSIRSFGDDGILSGAQAVIEHLIVADNGRDGVDVSSGSRVRFVSAFDNGRDGINASGSVVSHNVVFSNGGDGIFAGDGSTVSGNVARENSDSGIFATASTVEENATQLNRIGITAAAGLLRSNASHENTDAANNGDVLIVGVTTGYVHNSMGIVFGGSPIGTGQNLCGGNATCP